MAKTYNLFISHSWKYSDAYKNLHNLINNRGYFNFVNYSVPQTNPIVGRDTDKDLREAIKNKMRPCHAVLMIAGVYATHSKWINEEIDIAQHAFSLGKPIIGIKPWQSKKTSTTVKSASIVVVDWNTERIVSAIRTHALQPQN